MTKPVPIERRDEQQRAKTLTEVQRAFGPRAILIEHEGRKCIAYVMTAADTWRDALRALDFEPAHMVYHVANDMNELYGELGQPGASLEDFKAQRRAP